MWWVLQQISISYGWWERICWYQISSWYPYNEAIIRQMYEDLTANYKDGYRPMHYQGG